MTARKAQTAGLLALLLTSAAGADSLVVTGLTERMYVADSGLTSLDVSANSQLRVLNCRCNSLAALDLRANARLSVLFCGNNKLTALDVSANRDLTRLWCADNELAQLDISANPELTELLCGDNDLTSLDISSNGRLSLLWCSGNKLTNLDLTHNAKLSSLSCRGNRLVALDVTNNPELSDLDCSNNSLTGVLDLTSCRKLELLEATNNYLKEIVVWDMDEIPPQGVRGTCVLSLCGFYVDAGVTIRGPTADEKAAAIERARPKTPAAAVWGDAIPEEAEQHAYVIVERGTNSFRLTVEESRSFVLLPGDKVRPMIK